MHVYVSLKCCTADGVFPFSWADHAGIMIEWVYDVEVPESCLPESDDNDPHTRSRSWPSR